MKLINRTLVFIGFCSFLSGCGGGGETEAVEPITSRIELTAPLEVEEGSVVTFSVEATNDYQVSLPSPIELNDNGESYSFVAPNVSNTEQELRITVQDVDGEKLEHFITVVPVPMPTFSELPRGYPLESGNIAKHARHKRDEHGVPMYERSGNYYYYHIHLSKVAQVYYKYIRANNLPSTETAEFLAMATWLRDNCNYTEFGFCSWQADFEIPSYKVTPGWTSAMAQGQAITVLLGAYAITQDESYFEVLSDALAAFNYPLEKQGVSASFDGVPFYQEYGSVEAPSNVLNGFLFALAGLYDIADLTGSETAKQAFDTGVDALEQVIHQYDMGFTSRYDVSHLNQIASAIGSQGDAYHELHMSQLAWLYTVTDKDYALEYLKKFLMYDTGGIESLPQLADNSKKITEVEASSSISVSTHGPKYVWDSNWTWKRFWSSNRASTSLTLRLNNGSGTKSPIILNGLRLTSVNEQTFPNSIRLFDCAGDTRSLVLENIADTNLSVEYFHQETQYTSLTRVFEFDPVELTCDDIEFDLTPGDEGYFAIREISPFIQQPDVITELLSLFANLKGE